MAPAPATPTGIGMTLAMLLEHWLGHRRLTRRLIEAFPEDKLFTFSIGGMRPFSAMAIEMIGMGSDGIAGIATREWKQVKNLAHHTGAGAPTTKAELLKSWDDTTDQINAAWPTIPTGRFDEIDRAFGEYEGRIVDLFFYFIDNEIHHRGEGYVYLRALGIEPPAFYDRS